jgi:hypothetical protein
MTGVVIMVHSLVFCVCFLFVFAVLPFLPRDCIRIRLVVGPVEGADEVTYRQMTVMRIELLYALIPCAPEWLGSPTLCFFFFSSLLCLKTANE